MAVPSERKQLGDAQGVIALCERIDAQIAELRAAYEQYFLGLERRPPTGLHKELTAEMAKLRGTFVRHTGANFRVQAVQQKLTTYERLWSRTLAEIENGTYVRDLKKLKRRSGDDAAAKKKKPSERERGDDFSIDEMDPEEEAALRSGAAFERPQPPQPPVSPPRVPTPLPVPVAAAPISTPPPEPPRRPSLPQLPVVTPPVPASPPTGLPRVSAPQMPAAAASHPGLPRITPPIAAGAPRPAPAPSAPAAASGAGLGGVSEDKLRAVYDAFVKAKRRCNEDVSKMSFDQVAGSLRKQVPELMKRSGATSVEFKVVIKDGKAILRAVPKP